MRVMKTARAWKTVDWVRWRGGRRESTCAVIPVVLVGKFCVWTVNDEAGHKPAGRISKIKVPRSSFSHRIPLPSGGEFIYSHREIEPWRHGQKESWQKMGRKAWLEALEGLNEVELIESLWFVLKTTNIRQRLHCWEFTATCMNLFNFLCYFCFVFTFTVLCYVLVMKWKKK